MLRIWLCGVISTITTSVIPIKETGCVGRCPPLFEGYRKSQYLCHNDHDKYCVCLFGSPEVHQCGPDQQWSKAQECCVDCHPVADNAVTKGCKTQCPVNYTALIAHKSRSKYCHCKDGGSTVKDCPLGLQFSVEENTCIVPEDVKCDRENGIDYPSCIGTCPVHQDLDQIILLAHDECSKYCRCVDGYLITRICPRIGGYYLHFNLDRGMCISPEEAQCTGIGGIETTRLSIRRPTKPPISPSISFSTRPSSRPPIRLPTKPSTRPPLRPPISPPTGPPTSFSTRPSIRPIKASDKDSHKTSNKTSFKASN